MNLNSKPIKICFIAPKAYPIFNPNKGDYFGGAQLDLYHLATELAKDKNFQVSFIVADYGQPPIEFREGIALIKALNFTENPLKSGIKIWQTMRKANAQMYMYKTISLGILLIALFCRVHRRTFLYRTANTGHCDGTYLKQHPVMGKIYKWALRTAKLVFVQNASDKINLERTTGVSSIVIPNGHRISPLKEQRRDTILWVGRDDNFKRPRLYLDLAQKIPMEHFTIICQTLAKDQAYKDFMEQAAKFKNLRFISHVPFNQIDSYFQRAKVLVNTSESEGFPNTFIQACKCGTPILSLNVNPDGFLDEYNCGFCCKGNLQQMADSLRSMLAENKYIELGKNARKYAEKNHDIRKIVEEYKRLFRNLS